MLNKFLAISLILFLIIAVSNICYATGDIIMDLNTSTNITNNTNTTNTNSSLEDQPFDNTTIGAIDNLESEDFSETYDTSEDISVSTDYDVSSSDELSLTNIINIILIVVGIVLILLGIAIIIKLK